MAKVWYNAVNMGKFVVKYWKIIITLSLLLLIPAVIGMMTTRVNYDMLNYLPGDTETMIGQNELVEDFGKGAFSMVIVEDLSAEEEAKLEAEIREIPHVDTVAGLGMLVENGLPAEVLPEEVYDTFVKENETIVAVFFDSSSSADETLTAVERIKNIMNGHVRVSGMSAFVAELRALSEQEEIVYVILAVVLAIVVMLVLLDNWLAPILFLVSIGIMILINMGTNWMFGEISYITKALAAILQLAVTMDYSIFLWHSYREHLARGNDANTAMERAIKATLGSVVGSSATTVAGFIALCFMSFTLGLDLGLVMAKGVILGVIGAVTVLPALILAFDKLVRKFDHKPLMPKFDKLSEKIVKFAPVLMVIFVAIVPACFLAYQGANAEVYYTLTDSMPEEMDFRVANKKLDEEFGLANIHMILNSADLSQTEMVQMINELKQVDGVKTVLNLATVTGEGMPIEMLPEELVANLQSDKWNLSLVVSEYHTATDEMGAQIDSINQIIKEYDDSSLLVGEAALTNDMVDITSVDFAVVNSVSIALIFVIIAVVTKSATLPVILIVVIESAIFMNLGISYWTGEKLSFIAPICISTIQLGATIDYAILMTSRYKAERLAGFDKKKAAKNALTVSIPSIVVSGAVLFAATIGVAVYSQVDMISSLTVLMARGAVISVVVVPVFLMPLLVLADPLIIQTTIGMKHLTKGVKNEQKAN